MAAPRNARSKTPIALVRRMATSVPPRGGAIVPSESRARRPRRPPRQPEASRRPSRRLTWVGSRVDPQEDDALPRLSTQTAALTLEGGALLMDAGNLWPRHARNLLFACRKAT